ncbi:MAG TPA: DUF2589 domain-containing protein [Thermoanaerobaculia bacterium]|jgi:hypothetical protein|nr:DUF2589 domain-containing protein [Thermoanaerobaculia bacterium]
MATNPGQELSSINFSNMIGSPLRAVIEAQAEAALSTVNFIKAVGFKQGTSTDPEAGDTGDPIYVTRADEQVVNAISSAAAQFAEAERLVRQMLPVTMQKGLIGSSAASSWAAIENNADLGAIGHTRRRLGWS